MIPKIIHYCWFGGNELDDKAIRCIESWKRYFPDYKIVQWNESNFDIQEYEFMRKAYKHQKWAYVSDLARLIIIYKYGGLYFDTDVEIVSSYEDIIHEDTKGFIGFEDKTKINSGLGFGAEKGHPFIKKHIELYEKIDFELYINSLSQIACPVLTTKLMENMGLRKDDSRQCIGGLDIYPTEYFDPIEFSTGKMKMTEKTHSIHWYNASWKSQKEKEDYKRLQLYRRVLGEKKGDILFGIITCLKKEGLFVYVKRRITKR